MLALLLDASVLDAKLKLEKYTLLVLGLFSFVEARFEIGWGWLVVLGGTVLTSRPGVDRLLMR